MKLYEQMSKIIENNKLIVEGSTLVFVLGHEQMTELREEVGFLCKLIGIKVPEYITTFDGIPISCMCTKDSILALVEIGKAQGE